MTKLKKLIITRDKTIANLGKVFQADYPQAVEQYYKANLELIKSSNDLMSELDVGTILFKIKDRQYYVKLKNNIKAISYRTIKKVDKV